MKITAYLKKEKKRVDCSPVVLENCNIANCYMFLNGYVAYIRYTCYGDNIEVIKWYKGDEVNITFHFGDLKFDLPKEKYEWKGYELK